MPNPAYTLRSSIHTFNDILSYAGLPSIMSQAQREDLGIFLKSSVAERTIVKYDSDWSKWCSFVGKADPFLRSFSETDRALMAAMFLRQRHAAGLRGKEASGVLAAVRLEFVSALMSTSFLDSNVLSAARSACNLSTEELRSKRNLGQATTVKLPICESMLVDLRARFWEGKGWIYPDIDSRAIYIASMWGYDVDVRVSEYTRKERKASDHCVRVSDLTFELTQEGGNELIQGGSPLWNQVVGQFTACWVRPASHKCGSIVKNKLIGRRSVEESRFLDDLTEWMRKSGGWPSDGLFTRRTEVHGRVRVKELTGRAIRDNVKNMCIREGLDARFFSSHSLRKSATTSMRAIGVSEEDRRERGNYSEKSMVLHKTYDYSSAGHGPLSGKALNAGVAPGIEDVRRLIIRSEVSALGGGILSVRDAVRSN